MYCPTCRAEFLPEYRECSQCGVALVDEVPPEPMPEYVDLKTVLVAPNETVLMVAQSRLEAEGIRCFTTNNVQDLFALGRLAGYCLAIGPQELQVAAEDAERATAILEAVMEPEEEKEEVPGAAHECGAADQRDARKQVPAPDSSGGVMYCPTCGAAFLPECEECSQCGVAVVEELSPESVPEYADLKTVLVAPNETVLMVAQSRLEAEGIACFTTNNVQDLISGRITGYCLAIGPQELQVAAADFDWAKEILDAIAGSEEEE